MKEINLNADWLFCLGGEWKEEKAQKVTQVHCGTKNLIR